MAEAAQSKARELALFAKENVKVDPFTWIVATAGAGLALCAGMVNAIAFLELGTYVSHVTGNTSKAGLSADDGATAQARECALLVVSFVLGSLVCGCLIRKDVVSFGHGHYGYALVGNGILLVITTLTDRDNVAPYLASAACGLQNGVATSYSGSVIRTTHVTGIATDVGMITGRLIVRCCRNTCHTLYPGSGIAAATGGVIDDVKKLALLVLLGVSFLTGIVCGARLNSAFGVDAFLVPAIMAIIAGASYTSYRWGRERTARRTLQALEAERAALKAACVSSGKTKPGTPSNGRLVVDGQPVQKSATPVSASSKDSRPVQDLEKTGREDEGSDEHPAYQEDDEKRLKHPPPLESPQEGAPTKPAVVTATAELLEHLGGLRHLLDAALQSRQHDSDSAQAASVGFQVDQMEQGIIDLDALPKSDIDQVEKGIIDLDTLPTSMALGLDGRAHCLTAEADVIGAYDRLKELIMRVLHQEAGDDCVLPV